MGSTAATTTLATTITSLMLTVTTVLIMMLSQHTESVLGGIGNTTTFNNSAAINIPINMSLITQGIANPYPSIITVSGIGPINRPPQVTIYGFYHMWPGDVDVRLVSPDGTTLFLFSDVGDNHTIPVNASVDLTFSQSAPQIILKSNPIRTGTYLPYNIQDTVQDRNFPAPAPNPPTPGVYGCFLGSTCSLGIFANTNKTADGNWKLFIVDDKPRDIGGVLRGWSITFFPNVIPSASPTPSVTPSPTPSTSPTPTPSPTASITPTRSRSITRTPSVTRTPTPTPSSTKTSSTTPTTTPSVTATKSATKTPSRTAPPSVTPSATRTPVGLCGNGFLDPGEECDLGPRRPVNPPYPLCCMFNCKYAPDTLVCGGRKHGNQCYTKPLCDGRGRCRNSNFKRNGRSCFDEPEPRALGSCREGFCYIQKI